MTSIDEQHKGQNKRVRAGSISGRLRTASDLEESGLIDKHQKGFIKDLIISGDSNIQNLLDRYRQGDRSGLEDLLARGRAAAARSNSLDLLDGLDFDFLNGVTTEDGNVFDDDLLFDFAPADGRGRSYSSQFAAMFQDGDIDKYIRQHKASMDSTGSVNHRLFDNFLESDNAVVGSQQSATKTETKKKGGGNGAESKESKAGVGGSSGSGATRTRSRKPTAAQQAAQPVKQQAGDLTSQQQQQGAGNVGNKTNPSLSPSVGGHSQQQRQQQQLPNVDMARSGQAHSPYGPPWGSGSMAPPGSGGSHSSSGGSGGVPSYLATGLIGAPPHGAGGAGGAPDLARLMSMGLPPPPPLIGGPGDHFLHPPQGGNFFDFSGMGGPSPPPMGGVGGGRPHLAGTKYRSHSEDLLNFLSETGDFDFAPLPASMVNSSGNNHSNAPQKQSGGGGGSRSQNHHSVSSSSQQQLPISAAAAATSYSKSPRVGQHGNTHTPGMIGAYTLEQRAQKIQRFLEKRTKRVWTKKVKYDVRKNFADSRVRVKGRFVKKEEEAVPAAPQSSGAMDGLKPSSL